MRDGVLVRNVWVMIKMSKLDRLCEILLDEQDLIDKNELLPTKTLNEFNSIWGKIEHALKTQSRVDKRIKELVDRGTPTQHSMTYEVGLLAELDYLGEKKK